MMDRFRRTAKSFRNCSNTARALVRQAFVNIALNDSQFSFGPSLSLKSQRDIVFSSETAYLGNDGVNRAVS